MSHEITSPELSAQICRQTVLQVRESAVGYCFFKAGERPARVLQASTLLDMWPQSHEPFLPSWREGFNWEQSVSQYCGWKLWAYCDPCVLWTVELPSPEYMLLLYPRICQPWSHRVWVSVLDLSLFFFCPSLHFEVEAYLLLFCNTSM